MRAFASPLRRVELADRGSHIFSPPQVRWFTNAQNFLEQGPRKIGGDDYGKLAGIISIGDVVKHRLEDLECETNVLRDAYMATH